MMYEWKIATINVQGINLQAKRDDIIEWYWKKENTISSLTETKIPRSTADYIKKQYKDIIIFSTTDDENINSSGTSIIINSNLSTHIHQITAIPGRTITLLLKFRGRTSIAITSVYNSSSNRITTRKIA